MKIMRINVICIKVCKDHDVSKSLEFSCLSNNHHFMERPFYITIRGCLVQCSRTPLLKAGVAIPDHGGSQHSMLFFHLFWNNTSRTQWWQHRWGSIKSCPGTSSQIQTCHQGQHYQWHNYLFLHVDCEQLLNAPRNPFSIYWTCTFQRDRYVVRWMWFM